MAIATTEEFWTLMCDHRSVRLGAHLLQRGDEIYWVDVPPESVPGMVQTRMLEAWEGLLP